MKLILLATLLVAVFCGCTCPGNRCTSAGYNGSDNNCMCWCTEKAKQLGVSPSAKCTYVSKATGFSLGYCSLCDITINNAIDDFHTFFVSSPEEIEQTEANSEVIFPVRRCKCHNNDCNRYTGTLQKCYAWAQSLEHHFVDDKMRVTYVQPSIGVRGSCAVCGHLHPCKLW
ncbi:hypothetical protein RCL1_007583 [Eukaryota sp. TZLM3-RCL]